MARRRESATVDLKVRMKEPLRANLERTARKRGVSMNAEAVERLERSFARDEEFGGSEISDFVRLMANAFVMGGRQGARARRHPEWTPAKWIDDPLCYRTAAAWVAKVLKEHEPAPFTRAELEELMALYPDDDTAVRPSGAGESTDG